MGKVSFVPYLKKKHKDDKEGYICLIVVENGKSRSYSTGVKINQKELWNPKNNTIETMLRVNKSKMSDTDRIQIINKYNQLQRDKEIFYSEKEKGRITITDNGQSFLHYLNRYIKLLEDRKSIGTSKRFRTTLYHIEKYLSKKENKTTLLFSEITSSFIDSFETHLLSLGLIENTTKNYINSIKRLYYKGLGEGVFTSTLNPFINFKNVRKVVRKEYLEKKHIECILLSKFEKDDPLYNIRNYFLFQFFGQGLRVSDLLTLRWGTLNEGVFDFIQYKTKRPHQIYLSPTTLWILKDYVDSPEITKTINTKYNYTFKGVKYKHTIEELRTFYDEVNRSYRKSPMVEYSTNDFIELKRLLDSVLNKISVCLLVIIHNYSLTHKQDFVFPLITNPKLFDKVSFDLNRVMTKEQYNHLQTRTTVYNKYLKKLQVQVNIQSKIRGQLTGVYSPISISLTSHLPRHTYTNLMIESGGDVYEIKHLIGHENIQTTDKYMKLLRPRVENKNVEFGKEYSHFLS